MADKFLTKTGLEHFWENCKAFFAAKIHSHVGSEVTLTDYSMPSSTGEVEATDTVNDAVGKLEKGLEGKAASSHTHEIAEITDLQTTLNGKSDTTHNHNGVYAKHPSQLSDGDLSETCYITFVSGTTEYRCTLADLVNYLTTALSMDSYATKTQLLAYLTKSAASNTYLPQAGGTITGSLTVKGDLTVEGNSTLNGQ